MANKSTTIQRPQRWDTPFDPEMKDMDIVPILKTPLLSNIDQSEFPKSASFKDILQNDSRLVSYKAGDIVVRKGDYGHSAFIILSGNVRIIIGEGLPESMLGRVSLKKKSIIKVISQIWGRSRYPEERNIDDLNSIIYLEKDLNKFSKEHRTSLGSVQKIINNYQTLPMQSGAIFGEIAALCRTSRTATIFAEKDTELLEIRWQGLRDIRKRCAEFRKYIDDLYRQRSVNIMLFETKDYKHLDDKELNEIAIKTKFETYGDFEWFSSYKKMKSMSAQEIIENEPLILKEGNFSDDLIIIIGGFARVSAKINHGHRTVGYLRKGDTFGLKELTYNMHSKSKLPFQRSLRAIGYTDILKIPADLVEKHLVGKNKLSYTEYDENQPPLSIALPETLDTKLDPSLLEFFVEERFINGTETMLIDLEKCTRCDDCVRACCQTHDNQPRFIREGKKIGKYLVTQACMHCSDPVCLIGCPTGAIYRESSKGHVVINEQTCIGCQMCAKSCPYQSITMVEIRDKKGVHIVDQKTSLPILKAAKCDFCMEQIVSPACEKACPHNALKRLDMQDIKAIEKWISN